MTDELRVLMEEPPGGGNHGRRRTGEGSWERLDHAQQASLEEKFRYMIEVPIHGTRDCYVNERCRCKACRRANARYERQRRRGASGNLPEGV